ncbi:monovalent cation:H+ antiporter, CPA1 (nhx1) [Malassezia cuniculi]|uniref:Sodium/hydrogen exchanger n=1 Tax=Malassezia cuniculi TaxID=948313 RepID=A0AAF0EXK8_9BASI|nr:monovalent cation:H+ antiporter, CPA1 (nhx1) [Malassezia cuniculi]
MMAPEPDAEKVERVSSLALFLVLALLIGSFWTSYYLKVKRITAVHETIVGLFAGMFVGAALRIAPLGMVRDMLSFSNTIMLNVLLPPIILASGYELRQNKFFHNFGIIISFAFFGTLISAVVIGIVVWIWTAIGLEGLHVSLLDSLIFGSTLSATDPVTILAIFNTYQVDPQLYSIIFGESILNDAVSIVMFEYVSADPHPVPLPWLVFSVSTVLGVAFGLGCSLMLKHSRIGIFPDLESCVVLLIAYTSYFFSNAVQLSGIVSLLFCGITLKHYAHHNMSDKTQRITKSIFHTLANLSENFIFIYLGLSLFTSDKLVYMPLLIIVALFAVVLSRYCAVFPLAAGLNALSRWRGARQAHSVGLPNTAPQLSREYQIMLFWAGLRGAVGFALSEGMVGENAAALQTTVLVVVVLTVIVFGGTTAQMLDILHIETGVQDDEDIDEDALDPEALPPRAAGARSAQFYDYSVLSGSRSGSALGTSTELGQGLGQSQGQGQDNGQGQGQGQDQELPAWGSALPHAVVAGPGGLQSVSPDDLDVDDDVGASPRRMRQIFNEANVIFQNGQWFQRIDERYLLPMFSNAVASRKYEQRRSILQARRTQRDGSVDMHDDTNLATFEPDALTDEPQKKTH